MPILSSQKFQTQPDFGRRVVLLIAALLGLCSVYFFQQFNYLDYLGSLWGSQFHPYSEFVFNKTLRYLLNDNLCILMIYSLFYKRSYVMLGIYVELFGLVILLPVYFILKLAFEGDTELSTPLLSFYHRLVINPTLMILLILGLYYQQKTAK